MCTRYDCTYEERSKTTKFIDFVKVQKRSQFIIILALIFQVSVLIQQIFNFLLINFCLRSHGKCNACCLIPSHGTFPMGIPLPCTSLHIILFQDRQSMQKDLCHISKISQTLKKMEPNNENLVIKPTP